MLQIRRKLFALPLNQVYFQRYKGASRYEPRIVRYTHCLKPSRQLEGKKTVHINLKQDEQTLLHSMSHRVIRLLEEANIASWRISRSEKPTREELKEFQQFYNRTAKNAKTIKLTKFDIQTLQLLQEQGALVLTKLENEQGEMICCRAYVVSEEVVMALYQSGHVLLDEQMNKCADYFLCWENIRYFSYLGFKTYDFGQLNEGAELEEIRQNFGGKTVTVFSGYVTKSLLSTILFFLTSFNRSQR